MPELDTSSKFVLQKAVLSTNYYDLQRSTQKTWLGTHEEGRYC